MEKYQEIERSIITTYRSKIWGPFVKALKEYQLLKPNDSVCVCMSGGKDSFLMAKCFQELKRHSDFEFDVKFLVMDPGYNKENRELIIENAKMMNIPITIVDSDIFQIAEMTDGKPCYLCARMRRGSLYNKARELGCNKLALGHHYNDVIETTMLNVLYAGNFKTMLPKLKADNFEGIELIRPLYYVEEEAIKRFIKYTGLWPLNCACMVAAEKIGNKRHEIKHLIAELKKNFNDVDKSIFKAASNVNMNSILGWEKDGEKYSFLDPDTPKNK